MRTKGEGRSSAEKAGRLVVPTHVRTEERKRRRAEEEDWAARSGPVETRRRIR